MKKRTRKAAVAPAGPKPAEEKQAETIEVGFSWQPHWWRVAAIWLVALAAYSSSFRAGLVIDNAVMIGQDTRIRAFTSENLHLILSEELWYNNSSTNLYRPLTTFSYLINYAIFGNGTHPAGYHWVNFGIHALNILLVYLLGLLVFEEALLAWALAAIWGLHPLLIESVTNIVGRADLLAAFGVLGGLLCHVQAGRGNSRRRAAWLAGLGLAAAIGIFSKESAAVLPAILLLYDLTWKTSSEWRTRWQSYAAVALPFAVFFKLRADLLARHFVNVVPFLDNPLIDADFWTARLTAFKVIGRYFWLFLWPSRLSSDYSYNAVPLFGWHLNRWEDLAAIVSLLGCLAAALLALRAYRRWKTGFFLILFFFITIAPVANIFLLIGTIMAERFVYLPAVGLAGYLLAAGALVVRRIENRWAGARRIACGAVIAVCAVLAMRTFARNLDWYDERTLGASEVAAAPQSFKAHMLLASARLDGNPPELDGAITELDRMLGILDGLPAERLVARPFELAGQAFRRKGDSLAQPGKLSGPDSASAFWYRKALAALLRGKEADHADIEKVRKVNLESGKVASSAGWVPLYLELGRVYRRLNDPQPALEALAYGRLQRPGDEFSEEMSQTRLKMGDANQAAVALMEGLILNPNSTRLPADLVALYRQTAPDSCAVRASGINLECPLVHGQLCSASKNVAAAYGQAGQRSRAAATAHSAVHELGCPAQLFQ